MERIFTAFLQSETCIILTNCIKVNSAFHSFMNTADIHDEPVINKDPHVIVTTEFKVLSLHVLETCRNGHCITIVVLAGINAVSPSPSGNIPVKFRILDCLCGIKIFKVIQREETRTYRIVAISRFIRVVRIPKTFLIKLEVNIHALGVCVFRTGSILSHHLRNKPLFDFVGSSALVPRIFRGIHTSRTPIDKR